MMKKDKAEIEIADKIFFSEGFAQWARAYLKNPEARGISMMLNNQSAQIERTSFTYRKMNHWYSEGLIDDNREGNEWRRVSVMDAIWLHLIRELREWGLSLEQIKKVKESLSEHSEETKLAMPLLEYCAMLALAHKVPVILVVFIDGSAAPLSYLDFKLNYMAGMADHINININRIVQRFFPKEDLSPFIPVDFILTPEEYALLEYISSGRYEQVTITYKNGKMDKLEGQERIEATKKFIEIVKEQNYQKIEANVQDGKIVSYTRKVKKKISE